MLIPRGGKKLIETVVKQSTVPVLETGAGNCHLYIDETAEMNMAIKIGLNAKVQRPSVCNAIETILIHEKWFAEHGEKLLDALNENDVKIFGDQTVSDLFSFTAEDYGGRLVHGISWACSWCESCWKC